jgi:hypothetical protein
MNSPLVVEAARHLVSLADFEKCSDDSKKIQFLYERVLQRPPRPEEIQLGVEFVTEKPEPNVAAAESALSASDEGEGRKRFREKGKKPMRGSANFKRREPLKIWEEYAHALLQANETSFVD